jgi:hypothetical protein
VAEVVVASTFDADHRPWKLEHDLQYSKSSLFHNPQNP